MNSFVKETIKNALILCTITLVAGFLLGGVYEITKEPRAKQQEITRTNAYKEVIKEAASFDELDVDEKAVNGLLKSAGITEKAAVIDACIKAMDKDGNIIGYIVSATSKEGYGGNISLSVGFDMEGNVTGVSILSISETAGLGMEAKNESFLNQYKAEGDALYIVNKSDNEDGINIDALSGATITSKAVTKAVNSAKIVDIYLMGTDKTDKNNSEADNDDISGPEDESDVEDKGESDTVKGGEADE